MSSRSWPFRCQVLRSEHLRLLLLLSLPPVKPWRLQRWFIHRLVQIRIFSNNALLLFCHRKVHTLRIGKDIIVLFEPWTTRDSLLVIRLELLFSVICDQDFIPFRVLSFFWRNKFGLSAACSGTVINTFHYVDLRRFIFDWSKIACLKPSLLYRGQVGFLNADQLRR